MLMILLLITCAVLISWKWRNRKSYPMPPQYPGAIPIIGHGHMLIGSDVCVEVLPQSHLMLSDDVAEDGTMLRLELELVLKCSWWNTPTDLWKIIKNMLDNCIEQGGVTTIKTGPQIQYLIADPDDCETISNMASTKHYFYEFGKPWLGNGLLTSNDQTWKRHRKIVSSAYSQQILNNYIQVFNDHGRRLVSNLEKEVGKGLFLHHHYMLSNTLETVCHTAMDITTDQDDLNKFYLYHTENMLGIFIERFQKIWMHSDYIYRWTSLKKRQDESIRTVTEVSYKIIQDRKRKLEEDKHFSKDTKTNSGQFKASIDFLLEYNLDNILTDTEVREELDTIIAASSDTMGTALSLILLRLGSHLDVQERALEEIRDVLGDSDRDVEKDDLPKLLYLEGIIKETLRLNPTVPIIARVTNNEIKLKNYTLPAGSNCFMSIYSLNRHPVWGTDADEFKPERWLDQTRIPENPITISTFGIGKRSCLGRIYTLIYLKTTLVHLIRSYRITANYDKVVLKLDGMLKPKSGVVISIEKRT